jgi:hypothetical protein
MSEVLSLANYRHRVRSRPAGQPAPPHHIFFDRVELGHILSLYSRRVIAGDWRDYAIEVERGCAVFAIYGRSSDKPLYRIVKRPRAGGAVVDYFATGRGRVLKFGHSLKTVLAALEGRRLRLVEPA